MPATSPRHLWCAAALAFIAAFAPLGRSFAQADLSEPTFVDAPCSLPNVTPEILPRLRCGTVSVPRNYDNPGGGRFKLAVVVVRSAQPPSLPEPVVYINGGPGSPLTVFADHQARNPYAPSRDLILVDQRGTGRSEPKLCPDLDGAFLDTSIAIATNPSDAALAKRRTTYAACRLEATARGFDVNDFGTSITVADFEWVRRALGIERWNIYGESYGTTVAMTLMALHPETVRAAVLDSIYPPDPRPMASANVADTLDAFFLYCAGDQACATAYPDLAATYRETVSGLAQAPLIVSMPAEAHIPDDRMSLTSTLFEALVSRLIYYPAAYPNLPHLIATVQDRDSQGIGKVLAAARAAMAAEVNPATNLAVECRDRPHYRNPLLTGASVLDRLQPYGLCNNWSDIGPAPLVPIGTTLPTLVLAGEFDPITRPAQSQHVAALIGPTAHWVEFPRWVTMSGGSARAPPKSPQTSSTTPRGRLTHRAPVAPRLFVFFRSSRYPARSGRKDTRFQDQAMIADADLQRSGSFRGMTSSSHSRAHCPQSVGKPTCRNAPEPVKCADSGQFRAAIASHRHVLRTSRSRRLYYSQGSCTKPKPVRRTVLPE